MKFLRELHKNLDKHQRYKAFTLAEVLITLGIIGVIAALTIPNLIAKFQEQAIKQQFKKSYSTVTNAFLKLKADNGTDPSCYYGTDGFSTSIDECPNLLDLLKPELNITKDCPNNSFTNGCIPKYNGGDSANPTWTQAQKDSYTALCAGFNQSNILNNSPSLLLSDGTIIFQYQYMPIIMIDINGFKNPNKWGQDIFAFNLVNNGKAFKLSAGAGCMPIEGNGIGTGQMIIDVYK